MAGFTMEDFMGGGQMSSILGIPLSLYLAGKQNQLDTQALQNNTNLLGTSTALASSMGNETLPNQFALTQYDSSGNPYTAQVGLGYNPVQDLLNYQKAIRGTSGSPQGTITGNYEAGKANTRFYNEVTSNQTRGSGQRILNAYDQGAGGNLASYAARSGAFQRDLRNAGDETLSGYAQRYQRGMANLEGMGNQARKNINEQFDVNASNIGQSLASRGLGNTTIRQGMLTGNERERARATGELDESLRAQRLNTDASLSGDILTARQNIENQRAAAAEGALNTYTGLEGNIFGGRMNLLGNVEGANLSADLAGAARNYGLENQYGADLLAFDSAIGQRRQELGNNAAQNVLSILTGTNFGYPGSESMQSISDYWGGLGGFQATKDAMNIQDEQYDKAMTMGAFGLGMQPLSAFTGGFAGSYGQSLGQRV